MIHENIQKEMQEALRSRDTVKLKTLRGLLSSFTNELVATKRKPTEKLSDEEALEVIRKSAKQHKDSVQQFKSGGRNDLVEEEEAELKILEAYLPAQMSEDEIRKIAEVKKSELGIEDKGKVGILIGAIMKELKGKADGGDVKKVVDSLF